MSLWTSLRILWRRYRGHELVASIRQHPGSDLKRLGAAGYHWIVVQDVRYLGFTRTLHDQEAQRVVDKRPGHDELSLSVELSQMSSVFLYDRQRQLPSRHRLEDDRVIDGRCASGWVTEEAQKREQTGYRSHDVIPRRARALCAGTWR